MDISTRLKEQNPILANEIDMYQRRVWRQDPDYRPQVLVRSESLMLPIELGLLPDTGLDAYLVHGAKRQFAFLLSTVGQLDTEQNDRLISILKSNAVEGKYVHQYIAIIEALSKKESGQITLSDVVDLFFLHHFQPNRIYHELKGLASPIRSPESVYPPGLPDDCVDRMTTLFGRLQNELLAQYYSGTGDSVVNLPKWQTFQDLFKGIVLGTINDPYQKPPLKGQ
ncbi:hypothetical protein C4573_02135 [Candidatus Woesearchaeota archaeon]|nr:MAG: hypothetical protein C4573_02135 [Candidatus Woesearchaeota archaeon]